MPDCVGIRFDNGPKIHYVEAPQTIPDIGSHCVVSTKRGLDVGVIRTDICEFDKPAGHFVREAFADDVDKHSSLKEKASELKWLLKAKVRQADLKVKIVETEFNLDETLFVIHYSAQEILDLRPFIRDVVKYTRARIEFHNVGPRDQARMLGTLGLCGDGSCSSTWLQTFNAVGIRMAREQQLPLNPDKISGPCGRLMCCLQYEHEMYLELLRDMPRRGSKACHESSGSCGRVAKLHPLKQSVDLDTDTGLQEFPVSELVPMNTFARRNEGQENSKSRNSRPDRNKRSDNEDSEKTLQANSPSQDDVFKEIVGDDDLGDDLIS